MRAIDVLVDGFSRVRGVVHGATRGLDAAALAYRPGPQANSVGWLIWHLTRIQDDHVSTVAGTEQVYTAEGYAARFGLPFDEADTGYGHSSDQIAAVRPQSGQLLVDYYDAVHARTSEFLNTLADDDLSRIVDWAWDPPVTLAVRLVSVVSDDLQHGGQAAYVRGLLTG